MRDLVFFAFFVIIFAISFKKPFVAISIWVWSGIFVPVHWLYGFASSIRFNLIFSVLGVFSYLLFDQRKSFKLTFLFALVLLFFLHTTLTTATTVANPSITWIAWQNFMKVICCFAFICFAFRTKNHLELIIWIAALSLGFYGFVESAKFILSGGGHHIHGPLGHILADNNHLALALLMLIPLMIYLLAETPEKWLKIGLMGMIFLCVLAVLGTKSRGGFIGLIFMGSYFWLKSKHKFFILCLMAGFVFVASNLVSQSWVSRMNTIESADTDNSFMNRINAWKINTLMAMERPLLGGGFRAPQYGYIWRSLALNQDKLAFISTPPIGPKGWAAHSIYFQVLGDHGFTGFFLFIAIIVCGFINLSSLEKYFKGKWQEQLAKMLKISLAVYCIAGAALSMAYFEFFYVIIALIICLIQMQKTQQEQEKPALSALARNS